MGIMGLNRPTPLGKWGGIDRWLHLADIAGTVPATPDSFPCYVVAPTGAMAALRPIAMIIATVEMTVRHPNASRPAHLATV